MTTRMIRALTIKQPWAELLIRGEKTIECRTWTTPYRGPLLLHAAKSRDPQMKSVYPAAPCGCLIALAQLTGIEQITAANAAQFNTVWEDNPPGAYAWHLDNIEPFDPIPWRGQIGLFAVPSSVLPVLPG